MNVEGVGDFDLLFGLIPLWGVLSLAGGACGLV